MATKTVPAGLTRRPKLQRAALAKLNAGADALKLLLQSIDRISNDTADVSATEDTRDFAAMAREVDTALRGLSEDGVAREGFVRALAHFLCVCSPEGSDVRAGVPESWTPIEDTGGAFLLLDPAPAASTHRSWQERSWKERYAFSAACDISGLAASLQSLLVDTEELAAHSLAVRIEELSSVVLMREDDAAGDDEEEEAFRLLRGPEAVRARKHAS